MSIIITWAPCKLLVPVRRSEGHEILHFLQLQGDVHANAVWLQVLECYLNQYFPKFSNNMTSKVLSNPDLGADD